MFDRTIHRTIHFDRPFRLPGVDETIVAGVYEIDDDEVRSKGFPGSLTAVSPPSSSCPRPSRTTTACD